MYSLIIENSTDRGLIICAKEKEIIFKKEFFCGQNQAKLLMPYISECLEAAKICISDLACIGVGVGPGSYTGIRVGVSVAQALAFSYTIPVVEISTLCGFVPEKKQGKYAAIIDARIAGAYVQKNSENSSVLQKLSLPEICSLEQLPDWLGDIDYLVTPNSQSLQAKLKRIYPDRDWQWEERFPSTSTLVDYVDTAFKQGHLKQAGQLNLLYLKETLAEREKKLKLMPKK